MGIINATGHRPLTTEATDHRRVFIRQGLQSLDGLSQALQHSGKTLAHRLLAQIGQQFPACSPCVGNV